MKVIFEDDDLLIIDKPPGLIVDRSETSHESTLEDWLGNDRIERSGIVHRLDKDTSGLLLVAKTQEALDHLQKQFKERKVKKEYIALVHGLIESAGMVEGSIRRNPIKREKFIVSLDGKEAITEYEPLQRLAFSEKRIVEIFHDFSKIQIRKLYAIRYLNYTLVRAKPRTGRTHQIRVHLKYIGNPLVSDEKYVGRRMYRLDKRWCPRQFLHASKIGFYHPVSRKWMEVESELAEDLKQVLWKTFSYNLQ